ncbi:hypothetical protein CR203_17840 [Salipaludibacillus neizhouensis]|uniref:Uncharacterized protein n=1 Tax=Salipaludibacillus neizhouensis TaxID=885475 RepID=A0A3A9KEJ9_9BACI|nr:hypothetical protein [Salipaludibacillus neizhouensis]RKL65935.1 hypothetical protein CR203_17840 [Salipaludibacillus neizhouensis]
MKVFLFHTVYLIALIILSFFSFAILFGFGFVGEINIYVLLTPSVLSALWISGYLWIFLHLESYPNGVNHFFRLKSWEFISLFLAGVSTVFSLFLTTLFPIPIESAPLWMFLGTPVMMLVIWYWLFYRYAKNKNKSKHTQSVMNLILFILSLTYIYQICCFYIIHMF